MKQLLALMSIMFLLTGCATIEGSRKTVLIDNPTSGSGCHEHEDLTLFTADEVVFDLTDSNAEEFTYELC